MRKTYGFAAISICLWGSVAAVGTLLLGSLNVMSIVFYNCLFAALFLLIFNLLTGRLRSLRSLKLSDMLRMAVIGLLGIFFNNMFFYIGLDRLMA